VTDFLARHPQPLSDYSSASLGVWSPVFHYHYALAEPDTLLLYARVDPDPSPGYCNHWTGFRDLAGNPTRPRPQIAHTAGSSNRSAPSSWRDIRLLPRTSTWSRIATVPTTCTARRPGGVGRQSLRQEAQPGPAGHADLRPGGSRPLGPQHSKECLEVGDDIAAKRTTLTLQQESQALTTAIRDFAALGLRGLLLRIDDRPAAFSIYDRLNPTTALVLFERALRDKEGLYQVINQETARAIAAQG